MNSTYLTKEALLKLVKNHKSVILFVRDDNGRYSRKRKLKRGSLIEWRSAMGKPFKRFISCFERDGDYKKYPPSMKKSIERMYSYDDDFGLIIYRVTTNRKKVLWEA